MSSQPKVSAEVAGACKREVRRGRPPGPISAGVRRAGLLREEGWSLGEIARVLNREQVPTLSGLGAWTSSSVQRALARLRAEEVGR